MTTTPIAPEFLRQFDLDKPADANGLSERGVLLDLLQGTGEVVAWVTKEDAIPPLACDYQDGADCSPGVTITFFVPGHDRLWEVKGWKVRLWHFGDWCGRQSQARGWKWIRDDQDGGYSGRPQIEIEEEVSEKEIVDADGDVVDYEELTLYHVTVHPGHHLDGGEDFTFQTRELADSLKAAIQWTFYDWEPKDATDEEVLEAMRDSQGDWTLETPSVMCADGHNREFVVDLFGDRHACRPFFAVTGLDELLDSPEEAFDAAMRSVRGQMEEAGVSEDDIAEAMAALEPERRQAIRALRRAARHRDDEE